MSVLSSDVAALSKDFSGHLLLPGDPAWDVARRVHNGLVDKRPALVAQCRGSADIALAVRFTDSHFKGASLIVVGSVVRVKRGFSAAMGCYARLSSDLRAGADAKVAACGQAGGREHELAPW